MKHLPAKTATKDTGSRALLSARLSRAAEAGRINLSKAGCLISPGTLELLCPKRNRALCPREWAAAQVADHTAALAPGEAAAEAPAG